MDAYGLPTLVKAAPAQALRAVSSRDALETVEWTQGMSRKEDFQSSDHGTPFAKFHGSPAYQAAVDLAILMILEDQQLANADMTVAAANHYRIEGARTLLKKLNSFTELPKPQSEPSKIGQLKY